MGERLRNSCIAALTIEFCLLSLPVAAKDCDSPPIVTFTEPVETVDVAAREGGIVSHVFVKPGDRVHAGQVLAELEKTLEKANVAAAEARADARGRIDVAQAKLSQAQQRMTEILKLKGSHAVRPLEIMQARADVEIAGAEVKAAQDDQRDAELALDQAKARLSLLDVRAPYDGIVDKLYRRESEYVGAGGDPRILSLFKMSRLKADFFVPLDFVGVLERGSHVKVTLVRQKRVLDGQIRDLGREIDAPTGLRLVSVEFKNEDYALLGGERVEIDPPIGELGR